VSAVASIDLQDFLLQPAEQDWARLLKPFCPPLPERFDLLLATRFLDFFIVDPDGSVHWLDTHACGLTRVADTVAAFEAGFEEGYANWLMVDFVRAAVHRGQPLKPGQCYTFRELPVFSGEYAMDNVDVADAHATLAFLGEVFGQLRDVPDGAPVEVRVAL
jgi:hypothetical protein